VGRTCSTVAQKLTAWNRSAMNGRAEPPGGEHARDELDPVRHHDGQHAVAA
jgi:hypothetical protein